MKRTRHHGVIFFLLLLLILLPAFVWAEVSPPAHNQNMMWEGSKSSQREAFIKVVESKEEWVQLWKRAFDSAAPDVNFRKYVVACVFLGHSADWLFSIGFGEPYHRGNQWVIPYWLTEMVLELAEQFKASGQYKMKVHEKKQDAPFIMEMTKESARMR